MDTRGIFANDETTPMVEIAMRIPGPWGEPRQLVDRMPKGSRCDGRTFTLPGGTSVDFGAVPSDDQFAAIFQSACRSPMTEAEREVVADYKINILLSGRGGSLDAARSMMEAAAEFVKAGAGGVFIDNCGMAHGGEAWLEMTEDGGVDALSFAFVSIVRGDQEVWTMGMHALGQPEILMKRYDADRGFDPIEMIRYLCRGDKPVGDGHIIADLDGPRFKCSAEPCTEFESGSPFHNPFGRLRLVSFKEEAERN
jgi:hypothetical protein